jgi:hypothetical protein
LLKDLFEHVMGKGSLVDILRCKLNLANLKRRPGSGQRYNVELISLNGDNVVVIEIDDISSMGHDRTDVTNDKVLAFPDAQDQGAASPCPE